MRCYGRQFNYVWVCLWSAIWSIINLFLIVGHIPIIQMQTWRIDQLDQRQIGVFFGGGWIASNVKLTLSHKEIYIFGIVGDMWDRMIDFNYFEDVLFQFWNLE